MKIKMSQILNSVDTLKNLSLQKFPLSVLFKLHKDYLEVEAVIKLFEEKRKELFEKFGVPDKEKGVMTIPDENQSSYMQEINALLDEEVDINIQKVDLPPTFEMSVAELNQIDYLVNIPGQSSHSGD
jgi:hypothetical protein